MKTEFEKLPNNRHLAEVYESISKRNKEFIKKFLEYKKGYITDGAVYHYYYRLVRIADLLEKDFDKVTKEDMMKLGGVILKSSFSVKTKEDFITAIKTGYKFWLGENEYFPRVVSPLKRPKSRTTLKLPSEMLTEEQIYQLIRACSNYRDKFYIAFSGLDGALRPIEARNIKWGDIKKDKYGYYVTIYTAKKSGNKETRVIRIIKSEPYFIKWTQEYPGNRNDDNYVFVHLTDLHQINKGAIESLFKRLKKKLKFKRLYPYLMRHSLITRMSKDPKIPVAVLKKFIGHSLRSNTIAEYQHFGDDDLMDMQLEYNGIKKFKEDKPKELKPVKCTKCNNMNEPDSEFCLFCNRALSQKRMIDESKKIKLLVQELEIMKQKQSEQETELLKRKKPDPILDRLLNMPQVVEMIAR